MARIKKETAPQPIEQVLWASADKLRKNMDAAEYKHIVLGLIFLKYISDNFYELFLKLDAGEGDYAGADPNDPYEYRAENVFFVPPQARWDYLRDRAKSATIGRDVDDAMDAIEKDNPSLKGVLPKEYAKEKLDKQSLGSLIDIISTIALGDSVSRSNDVLGRVYEYFLGQFALAEGKKGGQFYTPRCVVQLLVEMLEPYKGRVFDPCCGSGGMFVQSEKFIAAHADRYNGSIRDIDKLFESVVSIFGQESNQTTWRLCKMNLALRGIDSSNVKWNNEGSFLNDAHTDLKAEYVIANPPFNDSDWSGELLRADGRWQYSKEAPPPTGNANYAWIQHFLYHLNPKGVAGFVLAKGSLSSKTNGEDKIRKAIIEAPLVDCIVNLPTKLFLNTQIPACLWFLSREKEMDLNHPRRDKILFIDARNMGTLINRRTRELTDTDIRTIADTYHNWKTDSGYEDIPGFCKSAHISGEGGVAALDYVLTPGRYIGLPDDDDDFDYETVCSFLNRFGGDIFLGVDDDGIVHGVSEKAAPDMIKNFISMISNPDVISPTVYLSPEMLEYEGHTIIRVRVPPSSEVHRYKKIIFDRVNDSDVKATATGQIAQMYIRKQRIFTEKKVFPYVSEADLRMDLLPRVRRMALNRIPNHEWQNMNDKDLLISAGLYGEDKETGAKGYNLAAVMLLGKDDAIQSVCPAYRTDALLRRVNVDRYDDRVIVKTNLIESFDQLILFAEKHLLDKFYIEGNARVSLRGIITREMLVNTLIHREFTSSFYAKFVIEKNKMYVENANRAVTGDVITPDNLEPESKNPCIASFFRNIWLADELGSGVRRLYHYVPRYSSMSPELIDGDVFRIIVPLDDGYSYEVGNNKAQIKRNLKRNDSDCALIGDAILDYLASHPRATQIEIATTIGKSRRTVQGAIAELKKSGKLDREGAKKNGAWIVISDS